MEKIKEYFKKNDEKVIEEAICIIVLAGCSILSYKIGILEGKGII